MYSLVSCIHDMLMNVAATMKQHAFTVPERHLENVLACNTSTSGSRHLKDGRVAG